MSLGKEPPVPIGRLGGSQNLAGQYGEVAIFYPLSQCTDFSAVALHNSKTVVDICTNIAPVS
jgi:hypothetical protein